MMYVELWREFGNPELDLMMTGDMHSGGIDGMMGMYLLWHSGLRFHEN